AGYTAFDYTGYDISSKAIEEANINNADPRNRFLVAGIDKIKKADYTVASGIFNIFMSANLDEWHEYVLESLEKLFSASTKACASNFLTSYSHPERMRDDLYYPDPREIFDHCMKLTPWVSIRHDYGLYDFTVIMRRL
ncbi:MAG: class I SAM-dependent methyltransferase, partial [Pseudomonadota bacterium]